MVKKKKKNGKINSKMIGRIFIIILVYRLISWKQFYNARNALKGGQDWSEMPVESEDRQESWSLSERLLISRQNHAALNEPMNVCVEEYSLNFPPRDKLNAFCSRSFSQQFSPRFLAREERKILWCVYREANREQPINHTGFHSREFVKRGNFPWKSKELSQFNRDKIFSDAWKK